ncbi:MAG: RidA family protein [Balneolaceae bacterium]
MKDRNIVYTDKAPEAIGPYSQATTAGGFVWCSGQIPLDPQTMEMVQGDVSVQARQVMENLKHVLSEAGSSFGRVIKCTIYLADMKDFASVNEVYGHYFPQDPPARETVAVKELPKGSRVEISCIALQ